ncbi:hypothetical protein [Paraburkholderia fungorum]|uniref:Uncharacterized protein n=1 Tax=Paraburkholderia fungorum TaxID=134537 RepID=A0AAW3V091_9BURK|nr:hypothetical protein [Paraburkholderia fungorum]MBB4517271.1 hypothetical protein [Paraburkholderia fungorum]MBB6204339.1 hypothetical protein [Paraburkholderia fungorum]
MSTAVVTISVETISDVLTKQGNPALFETHIVGLLNDGYPVGISNEGALTKVFTDAADFAAWFGNLRTSV